MTTNQLLEQRWAMLSNPHYGPLPDMTAPAEADYTLATRYGGLCKTALASSAYRWQRFVNDQWANRN